MCKRILFIIEKPGLGGTNSSLRNFLSLVNLQDVQISLLFMGNNGVSKFYYEHLNKVNVLPGIPILNAWYGDFKEFNGLQKFRFFSLKIIKKIRLLFNEGFPDSLYHHLSRKSILKGYDKVIAFSEGEAIHMASFISASKHYAWIHCNLEYSKINSSLELKYYKKFDKIYAVSKHTAEVCKEMFPSISSVFDYIYNVIDYNLLMDNSLEVDSDLINIPDEQIVIISIGRICPIKQFSLIPSIVKQIIKEFKNISWYIIGEGDETEKNKILRAISEYNVYNYVKLLGYKSNPAPLLRRANIYVCTSFSEACPMVFLEANALNTYIISSEFPSAYEILTPKIGKIVSIDKLAQQIINRISEGASPVCVDRTLQNESINKFQKILI